MTETTIIIRLVDDVRSAGGSFDTVVLPKRIFREFFSRHLAADKIFSSTASRLIQDGLLVGISSGKFSSRQNLLYIANSVD
jgi:hypothetical protein